MERFFRRCGKPRKRYLLRKASTAREASGAITIPRSTFIDDLGRLAGKAHRSDILLVRLLRSVRGSEGKSYETFCRKQVGVWGGQGGEGSARLRSSFKIRRRRNKTEGGQKVDRLNRCRIFLPHRVGARVKPVCVVSFQGFV